MEDDQKKQEAYGAEDSLEAPSTVVENQEGGSLDSTEATTDNKPAEAPAPKKVSPFNKIKGLFGKFNVYLLMFVFVILIAIIIVVVAANRSAKEEKTSTLPVQNLTQEALDQIKSNTSKIGDPKSILNIESNAVFSGKVLIRDSLDVAGPIKVGGALTLPGITVSGASAFDQVTINNLQISGNTSIQGTLSVQRGLTVSGPGTFGGPISAPAINVDRFQINGDLSLNRHIDAGGGTPGKSDGSALGGGGTSSVSGTDTAGTVAINTGGSPAAGCFTTVNFSQRFNGTPHVVITPVGSAAGSLNYYINRTNTNFSICSTNAAPAGQSFAFDYVVID